MLLFFESVREFGESAGESLAYAFGLPFALYAIGESFAFFARCSATSLYLKHARLDLLHYLVEESSGLGLNVATLTRAWRFGSKSTRLIRIELSPRSGDSSYSENHSLLGLKIKQCKKYLSD